MLLKDQLDKETIRKFNQLKRASADQKELKSEPKPIKNKSESLSRRDLEELMGTRRDTYKRVKGALRRK